MQPVDSINHLGFHERFCQTIGPRKIQMDGGGDSWSFVALD